MTTRLREIIAQRAAGGELVEFNGEPDHVHPCVSAAQLDLSRFINKVKRTSNRLIRRDFGREPQGAYRKPVFWSGS